MAAKVACSKHGLWFTLLVPDGIEFILLYVLLCVFGCCQASHEAHISLLDSLEDRLVGHELAKANSLADTNNAWQEQRHR